jgi:hypothetical protein
MLYGDVLYDHQVLTAPEGPRTGTNAFMALHVSTTEIG